MSKDLPPHIKLIEEAGREAAWKALHGTPEERTGHYLGKQEAVEKAAARVRAKLAARGYPSSGPSGHLLPQGGEGTAYPAGLK